MFIDLFSLSVLSQESSQHSLSAHPEDLAGHSALAGTSSFTHSGVATSSLFLQISSGSGSGVDFHGLLHDETILSKFSNASSWDYKEYWS